jgi:hypothetical protein
VSVLRRQSRAATGLTIASYSVIDGLGVRHAHDALAYAGLLFLILGPVFPVAAATRRPLAPGRSAESS